MTCKTAEWVVAGLVAGIALPAVAQGQAATPVQYTHNCVVCHGDDAAGSDRAPGLVGEPTLRSMSDEGVAQVIRKGRVGMPAFALPDEDIAVLVRFVRSMNPATGPAVVGAVARPVAAAGGSGVAVTVSPMQPAVACDWPTYNGTGDGNRYSTLNQIGLGNVARLKLAWSYGIPSSGLETTPLVVGGVMYATGTNSVFALDAATGQELWRYQRPRSAYARISTDASRGVNRGVAVQADRVFYMTDDARLIALDRQTGKLLWDVYTAEEVQRYGGTSAPLVVDDLVVTGVSGADDGIRGFIAAYKVATGALAWRVWTVPKPGEPGSETWRGSALALGGGSTWLTGSFDAKADVVYWAIGNPHPDTDGTQRLGSNLYTNSDVALDAKTGRMLWHYQYTPHDLHDWDANEPIVLVDTTWRGQQRKLLLHANRNGFLYVLDRTTGVPLLATKMVNRLTWASGIDPKTWLPQLLPANETTDEWTVTCPAVRGATNWYSTAWSPATRLYYVMTVEDCGRYRRSEEGGFGWSNDRAHPAEKILRAFDIETGKAVWQVGMQGNVQANYSGVLATAGGLVFYGDNDGGFAAVDATDGRALWHVDAGRAIKASPMTYAVRGRQFVSVAAGGKVLVFALAE